MVNHFIALSIIAVTVIVIRKISNNEDRIIEKVADRIACDNAVKEVQNIINSKFINND